MREILLCKYGEIVLKGANKRYFEDILCKQLRTKAARYGRFTVLRSQSTIYIEPEDDNADIDGMFEAAMKTFGIVAIGRAAECKKDIEDIKRVVREYIPDFLEGKKSFKVEGKRSDKTFPYDSMQIAKMMGGEILGAVGGNISVDVHNPEIVVRVEIRERAAYIHAGQFKAAGGMPVGTNGHGLLLFSGGIDSPVAGYMMAKRGMRVEAVHFESFPYTSEMARDKVLRLAGIVANYTGEIYVHIVSLTHIQEELVKCCDEEYFTLLLRRYMMYIACKIASKHGSTCLITGESLGQVASQTSEAITVTNNASSLPVFRPCIGMDKEEIVEISRKIGAFETSIEPYEDCCTVFTPRHPRTRPVLEKVLAEENKLDFESLADEAINGAYTVKVGPSDI